MEVKLDGYLLYLVLGVFVLAVVFAIQRARERANAIRLTDGRTKPYSPAVPAGASAEKLSNEMLEEQLKLLIGQRKKIEAIKLLRTQTNIGLKEAKDSIDAMERGHGLVLPGLGALGMSGAAEGIDSVTPVPNVDEVKRLIRAGNKIEAIKLVRESTGLGLAEAKAEVERLGRLI